MTRLFDVLRQDGSSVIKQEDLKSMMAGILACHRGLEFLHETPEFQDRSAPGACHSAAAQSEAAAASQQQQLAALALCS